MFPEIFQGSGTSEGAAASDFWFKWGWYASYIEIAKDWFTNLDYVLNTPALEMLKYLAYKMDKAKLEASLRKESTGKKVTAL